MNKQEAIKIIEKMGEYEPISKKSVLNIINQINEPKKQVIPKFVAEWIERVKKSHPDLGWCLAGLPYEDDVSDWMRENPNEFFSAWLYGYDIEQEKLYTVKILGCTLFKMTSDNHVRYKLIGENETPSESKFSSYKFEVDLTESEIKQDFEWAWQFAKEVGE